MGFLRHDGPQGRRFQMREKIVSIGDDAWIEDEHGDRVYKVDGKAFRVRDTLILKDRDGREALRIQERKLHLRNTMAIERDGKTLATIHMALIGIRERFEIEVEHGDDLKAHGNVVDHEYEIERDGDTVATVSKKWFRLRDSYGIEIAPGEDEPFMLAVAVAIDQISHD